jgi:hypothetical protein
MVRRSELEQRVRGLVCSDIIYRVLESLGEKGSYRLRKKSKEIAQLLKSPKTKGRFFARIETDSELRARGMREGIKAFKDKHPRYGEILEHLIEEERSRRNRYLIYGLNPGYNLSEREYLKVMKDLGFDTREASALYPHILAISERLENVDEHSERKILIG